MFTLRNGEPLLSHGLQPDITANGLKHISTIELLRLRGKYVNSHSESDIIQTEVNRRQRREYLACTTLIVGAILLITVLI